MIRRRNIYTSTELVKKQQRERDKGEKGKGERKKRDSYEVRFPAKGMNTYKVSGFSFENQRTKT